MGESEQKSLTAAAIGWRQLAIEWDAEHWQTGRLLFFFHFSASRRAAAVRVSVRQGNRAHRWKVSPSHVMWHLNACERACVRTITCVAVHCHFVGATSPLCPRARVRSLCETFARARRAVPSLVDVCVLGNGARGVFCIPPTRRLSRRLPGCTEPHTY